jgi:hypothetical protein
MKKITIIVFLLKTLLVNELFGAMDESEKKLNQIPQYAELDTCAICLQNDSVDYGLLIPCGHIFHAHCISRLLLQQKKHICEYCLYKRFPCQAKCPLCRTKIKSQTMLWQYPFNKSLLGEICLFGVKNNYPDVVKTMLAHGANVNARDIDGRSLLKIAIEYNHEILVDLLKQHSAL